MDIASELDRQRAETRAELAGPGDWLTGAQRIEAWAEARDAADNELDRRRREAVSPLAVAGSHPAGTDLPAAAVEVVHRLASDPGRLTRSWAQDAINELGEETYTELVGLTAITAVLDHLDRLLGDALAPLPTPVDGAPTRVRPPDVGDVGAWVSQATEKRLANVSRSISLVPVTMRTWQPLVQLCYSRGTEFADLVWDRALSRPQVELTAARTTALNECFY